MTAFTLHLSRSSASTAVGTHALLEAIVDALARQGIELDLDAAYVLSGAAFRTYQFAPSDNWAWETEHPDERWRWQTLDVENYGVVEAISAHASGDIRRWEAGAKPAEWYRVASVELGAGRPVLAVLPGAADAPDALWVCDAAERAGRRTELPPRAGAERCEIPVADLMALPAEGEPTLTALYTVRPSPTPTPPGRLPALWRDVLVFATRHATSKKELSHREELFYASGVRAWEVTTELLGTGAPGLAAYWTAWRAQVVRAREAAARVFARWPEWPGAFETPDAARERLHEAGEAFGAVAEAVAALPDDPATVAVAAIDAIVDLEVRAIAELTLALRGLD